jgi:uncharacterized protein YndB with AHSA1/START domain
MTTSSDNSAAEHDNNAFVISRMFDTPREIVFKALTEPERMKQWWGPKGFTVIASTMDLRRGGTYHYGLSAPDGSKMWGKFVYREIVPPKRLVFVHSFSDENGRITRHPMSPNWPLQMLSTFLFAEQDRGTTFTVKWSPLNPTPEERATFDGAHDGMRGGWTGTMDQLAAYLTSIA